MRIRKRTPARAASPGPSPALSPSPPPQTKEVPREEEDDDAEEKRVILVAGPGGREAGRVVPVPDASKNNSAATDGVPKPEPLRDDAARCNRNDGKRWRCKNAAVPGYLFCDRHVAWSVRQRQPRANRKQRNQESGGGVFEPVAEKEEEGVEDKHVVVDDGSAGKPPLLVRRHDDGFYYYDGFQPGGRKRARGAGPGPAA